MSSKLDPTTLDLLTIRRALHNAVGRFEAYSSEFAATWHDPKSNKKVDFKGTIDSQISLKTAQVQGSGTLYDLKNVLTDAELKGFNYLINAEHIGHSRLRSAA